MIVLSAFVWQNLETFSYIAGSKISYITLDLHEAQRYFIFYSYAWGSFLYV